MFAQKKGKADITQTDHHFSVRYAGKVQTYVPNGRGCTQAPVQKIWDNSLEEKDMKRVDVLLNTSGILVRELSGKKPLRQTQIDIKDISYCCAEKGAHDRVFAWVCKAPEVSRVLECHAMVCATREEAKKMALVLSQSFQIAYRDWKTTKEKASRMQTCSQKQERTRQRIASSNSETVNSDLSECHCSDLDPDVEPELDLGDSGLHRAGQGRCSGHDHDGNPDLDLGDSGYLAQAMAQMNIVEEEVISFTENNIVVEPVSNGHQNEA